MLDLFCTPLASMHRKDSHWFLPMESPANMILPFLLLSSISVALNLQEEQYKLIMESRSAPGKVAAMGLPSPIEVAGIVTAIATALKPRVEEGAVLGVGVEPASLVPHPPPEGVIAGRVGVGVVAARDA
ncbi:hypothetical protein B296_00041927 [Ensete ventricosum]|uniref:Uncharacterized protein n=1 Tax=Ensete ventricosum TaxID=4639 RepID=A0A426YP29_ENSVE|nr:hypothetical protein B296_00041927 [Ensete ventricosum]